MPELHLPDFRQTYLTGISFCSSVPVEQGDNFSAIPREGYAWYEAVGVGTPAVFVVQFNECEGGGQRHEHHHLHFNLDIEDTVGDLSDFTEAELSELKDRALLLFNRTASATVVGDFSIPLDDLPKRGLVATLLKLATPVASWQLAMTGARFALEGDTFTNISWDVDEDHECIDGRIEGYFEGVLNDDVLTHIADTLEQGIHQILIERSEGGKSHGKTTRRRKTAE